MEGIAREIHKTLIKKKKTVAVAESCTGGLLSEHLSRFSGSSKYFILGVVAYSNKAKTKILKVPAKLISKKGAVSKEVALKMAQQVRKIAQTDLGIAVTGIAGPTGGTVQKPVGTIFIALRSKNKEICKELRLRGKRANIRKKATTKSLELLNTIL